MNLESQALSPAEMQKRMQMLRYKVHEKKIEEVWTTLLREGFKPLIIKGWAAAQFYPEPYKREFSDLDIVINPQEFEAAAEFLKKNPSSYSVDLHRGLRRHDTLPYEEIYAAAKIVRCGDVDVRIPRLEDHLRILCVHWLTDGGAYREKLWDIYHAIDNRPADFDWVRFLESVSPTRRRWLVCTVGLAHKYLGLRIDDTPIFSEARKLPKWLIEGVEREWTGDTKLQPLAGLQYGDEQKSLGRKLINVAELNFRNREQFWKQIQKRLFPNPIHATVDVEGDFDRKPRFFYQLKSFFRRLRKFGKIKDE